MMSSVDASSTANNNTLSVSPISSTSLPTTTGNVPLSSAAAAGIAIAVIVLICGVLMCYYIQGRRQLCRYCLLLQKRRQSTSFGQLTNEDTVSIDASEKNCNKPIPNRDQDGGHDDRSSARCPNIAEDDYFYDEIFERSAFVDETTNRANKDLTILVDDDDFDDASVPKLEF